MARITVEDCLEKVDNRFKLIHLAAKRVRQLRKGAEPLVTSKNTDLVVSLREIAAGEVIEVENNEYQNHISENTDDLESQKLSEQAIEASPGDEETAQDEKASQEENPVD